MVEVELESYANSIVIQLESGILELLRHDGLSGAAHCQWLILRYSSCAHIGKMTSRTHDVIPKYRYDEEAYVDQKTHSRFDCWF